jgi:hypothetical protein
VSAGVAVAVGVVVEEEFSSLRVANVSLANSKVDAFSASFAAASSGVAPPLIILLLFLFLRLTLRLTIFLIVSYTYSQYFILPILRINSSHFQRLRVERDFFLNTRLADFLYLREGRFPPPCLFCSLKHSC